MIRTAIVLSTYAESDMSLRIRLLPILIFVAILMLSAKISGIIYNVQAISSSYSVGIGEARADSDAAAELQPGVDGSSARAVAQAEPQGRGAPDSSDDAVNTPTGFPTSVNNVAGTTSEAGGRSGFLDAVPTSDRVQEGEIGDLSNLSASEVRLLFSLAERRRQIINRERELIERESLLRAVEQQLEVKQAQLNRIQADIEDLLKQYDIRKDEENDRLRSIYSSMKPKAAAQIFNNLDINTLVGVLDGMSPRIVAPIVADMNVDRARQLTQVLAERRIFGGLNEETSEFSIRSPTEP